MTPTPTRTEMPMAPLNGLTPLLSSDIHTIILGSFPSRESLAAGQYYAHPRNQFWRLLSEVLNDNLAALPYEDRLPRLLSHGIGLWDVIPCVNVPEASIPVSGMPSPMISTG